MKAEILNNGGACTVKTVEYGLGLGCNRAYIRIDIAEKYRCRNYSLSNGDEDITVMFFRDEDDTENPTQVILHTENDGERRMLAGYTMLPDPGKYEFRLWLVATVDYALRSTLFELPDLPCGCSGQHKFCTGRCDSPLAISE